MAELAYALTGHSTMEGRREAVRLYEDLRAHCTDPAIRKNLDANLSTAYARIGEKDKAIATAEKLPNLYKTVEVEMADLLTGDALTDFLQNEAFQKVVWCFYFWVRKLCSTDNYTAAEKLTLLAKSSDFYDLVYENHDHNFGLLRQLTLWQDGAEIALAAGMVEEALACLEKSAHFAALHDGLPMGEYHPTSLLVNRCTFNREWDERPGGRNCRGDLLADLRTEERYLPLRENERFQKILASLEV